MITIFKKEINEFFSTLTGYLTVVVFLSAISLIMWVFPDSNVLDFGYASMEPVFSLGPYVLMFLVPAITMKSFAEEKRNGTLELLLTLPLSSWQIVVGKWLAAVAIVVLALVPTLFYYYTVYQFGNPIGNLDTSGIVGSYLGLVLLGAVFTAIGIFCSAVTDNQVVSFVIAAIMAFVFFDGVIAVSQFDVWGGLGSFLESISLSFHYNAMSRGLLEMADLSFFSGFIILLLLATWLVIELRK